MMVDNGDGTFSIKPSNTWTTCLGCGQRVTGDSIHTCSPQLRELSDEEILEELLIPKSEWEGYKAQVCLKQVRAILKKASEK